MKKLNYYRLLYNQYYQINIIINQNEHRKNQQRNPKIT